MNNGEIVGPRGRGRGWQQPDNQPRELRRPKNVTEEPKAEAPVESVKSNLSADAKEWYPPNYNPQTVPSYNPEPAPYRPHRSSVQERLLHAQDRNAGLGNNVDLHEETENMSYLRISSSNEDYDLQQNICNLITVMCEITFDPGKFDTLCGPLVDSFASTLHDANYTSALVDAIVNQSIGESNFRYNGARLCSMYDSVAPPEDSKFRACLLERCSTEENKIISGMEVSEENVRGFAMFLAEIYTQLEDSQGGRIKTLGESLCKVLLHLLDTDKEVNIKAVCQLLKLSGLALDADCGAGTHAMFERLRLRAAMPAVRAVMELRAQRWGFDTQPAPRRTPSSNGSGLEGGFLADGAALTAEERAFLHSHLPDKQALDDDILEELENDAWDTGMDAEMQAGFLEFLKISNQIKR